MLLYPFKNLYLKTSLTRIEIADRLKSVSYLSDLNFKKNHTNAVFYGFVQKNDFALQNIINPKLVGYFEGNFLGVEQEMYIFIQFKAYKYRRVYAFLIALLLGSLIVVYNVFKSNSYFSLLPTLFALVCFGLFIGILLKKAKLFKNNLPSSINYMRGLLEAEETKKGNIPTIFHI